MRFFPPSKIFSVLEIGAVSISMAIVDKKTNGQIQILGTGQTRLDGLEKGRITNGGDLAEALYQARLLAEASAGASAGKLYYNLDDPGIQSVWPQGSRLLDGEGEIQARDVRAAVLSARRLAGDFEKKIIYAAEIEYVIDGRDPVKNPIGIFGHQLDVKMHVLLVDAERLDLWGRLMSRAGFKKHIPVLSGLSSAYSLISDRERQGKKIVWDLGKDYFNGLLLDGSSILEYRTLSYENQEWGHLSGVVLALCQEFHKKYPDATEILLTGDLSGDERIFSELKSGMEIPARNAAAYGIPECAEPSRASLAGLIRVALQAEGRSIAAAARPEKDLVAGARERMRAFLSDYF